MDRVFIVMADEREYCSNQWVVGVFSTEAAAEDCRAKAQARTDEVHAKIRALGEEEGIPARWRDVCISKEQKDELEALEHPAWLAALQKLKREFFPEDPDAEVSWDGTLHYTVEEWSVDSREVVGHKRCRF